MSAILFVRTLSSAGWRHVQMRGVAGLEARCAYEGSGAFVELDLRPDRGELWLWLHGQDDRRCLGLQYEGRLEAVLAALVGMQDRLTMDDYLSLYSELGAVCPTSIIAWEQFDNAVPTDPGSHR